MMEDSRIFSKLFTNLTIKLNSMLWEPGMSIDSLMIWLHMLSSLMVDSYGHARIMMVMFNQMLLPKVMVHLVS